MIIQADARRLPFRANTFAAVISGPPSPTSGVWENGYVDELDMALDESRRVLRPGGQGWFLLRHTNGEDWWYRFDPVSLGGWSHRGTNHLPVMAKPGVYWGVTDTDEVAAIVARCTRPGDLVLDPFAGRGGIPRVARKMGRVFVACDIDAGQLLWR
jgi:tRNA G10  N-methylase Trm11